MLEEIGGREYIGKILNTVPSAAHGEHYAKIVREKALLRQLIAASNDIRHRAARNQPHRELDAFRICLPDIFDVRHLREALVAVN